MPTIHVEGLEQAINSLDQPKVKHALSQAVDLVTHQVMIRMAVYPPESAANTPGPYPGRWYQRLFGPRWRTASGSLRGKNTSERLQQSWRQSVISPLSQLVDTLSPRTGRPVSYVGLVVGEGTQAEVHRQHGWQTDESVAQEVANDPAIEAQIMAAIDQALR